MTIKSYKVGGGGGLLSVGEVATAIDATAQVTEAAVEFKENVEDGVPVLSGEELPGDATYPATFSATLLQDLTPGGLVRWSWANRGKVLPLSFTPSEEDGTQITGMVRIGPMNVGGKVKERPTSDVEWAFVGDPEIGDGL